MLSYLYRFFIILLESGIGLASLWNPKARLWIKGRKRNFAQIQEKLHAISSRSDQRIWMHCASLGEFEQGRPLLEELRKAYPGVMIIISFFSSSGYEVRKNYTGADLVCYLPSDRPENVRKLLNLLQPTLVLWVRYEFWHNYLRELAKREIPVLLVSALFREQHLFFKSYGGFWRDTLRGFTHLFVQNSASAELLDGIGFSENVTISGDTRFDRVSEIAGAFAPLPVIEKFCSGYKVLVAGSTWPEDEEELVHYIKANDAIRFIIAPHEVDTAHIQDIQKSFPGAMLYSDLAKNEDHSAHILIINNIGMLSRLYAYADIAYVGGGFGDDGLHNILEAAVYGKPVVFGPVYQKHYEAADMIDAGGAISVKNAPELEAVLNRLFTNSDKELQERGEAARSYVRENVGATAKIMAYIQRNRLCTN